MHIDFLLQGFNQYEENTKEKVFNPTFTFGIENCLVI